MRQSLMIIIALAIAGCSSANQQITCPVAETGKVAGSLQETPAQIKAASNGLGRGDENQIAGVASRVRTRHPSATNAQIVDYIVTAYCPKINANATIGKADKQRAMQSFASRVDQIVELTGKKH